MEKVQTVGGKSGVLSQNDRAWDGDKGKASVGAAWPLKQDGAKGRLQRFPRQRSESNEEKVPELEWQVSLSSFREEKA